MNTFTGNMAGSERGAGPRIEQDYPKAPFFWCAVHQLNRKLVKPCQIQIVWNVMAKDDKISPLVRIRTNAPRTITPAKLYCFNLCAAYLMMPPIGGMKNSGTLNHILCGLRANNISRIVKSDPCILALENKLSFKLGHDQEIDN